MANVTAMGGREGAKGVGGDVSGPNLSVPSAPQLFTGAEPATESPGRDPLIAPPEIPPMKLPNGGGAIRSIGESYEVNAATGTFSGAIPIYSPSSRPGAPDPQLSIGYGGGSGNGPFGLGWAMGTSSISRKTEKLLPRYDDANNSDSFLLSGHEDLVPTLELVNGNWSPVVIETATHTIERFRPRVESEHLRIERRTDRGTGSVEWWTANGNNVWSRYGSTADSRIADPNKPGKIFSWLLDEVHDDRGSITRYIWQPDDERGVAAAAHEANRSHTAGRLLKRIDYGNFSPHDDTGFHFSVVFDYGDHDLESPAIVPDEDWALRADAFSSYRAGFEVRQQRLCRRVLIFHHFPQSGSGLGPDPVLVRATEFAYDESPSLTQLVRVTEVGYEGSPGNYTRHSLPPVDLGYVPFAADTSLHDVGIPTIEMLPAGLASNAAQWIDLDNEGLSGALITTPGASFYKRNEGGGRLGAPKRIAAMPTTAGAQFSDVRGNGGLAAVTLDAEPAGFFDRTEAGWDSFIEFKQHAEIDWSDPQLRMIDLDGDGRPDLVIVEGDVLRWYRSEGADGYSDQGRIVRALDDPDQPVLVFDDGTEAIFIADMVGDGLADIVRVRSSSVTYWPNLGYGRFANAVTMSTPPRLAPAADFDPRRVRFADVDGNGTSDLVHLRADSVEVWMNQSGNSFAAAPLVITGSGVDPNAVVSFVDLMGTGTTTVVWSSAAAALSPMRYADLCTSTKPYLLRSIDNNMGRLVEITHTPSTAEIPPGSRRGPAVAH